MTNNRCFNVYLLVALPEPKSTLTTGLGNADPATCPPVPAF